MWYRSLYYATFEFNSLFALKIPAMPHIVAKLIKNGRNFFNSKNHYLYI